MLKVVSSQAILGVSRVWFNVLPDIRRCVALITVHVRIPPQMLQQHVAELHLEFRSYCDIMAIGLGPGKSDTVAEEKGSESSKEVGDVRRFLNRMLGLPVARQNLLFNYFASTLAAEIRAARLEGRYSEGVSDLGGARISQACTPSTLWVDPKSRLRTMQNTLLVDRGVGFEAASRRLELEAVQVIHLSLTAVQVVHAHLAHTRWGEGGAVEQG